MKSLRSRIFRVSIFVCVLAASLLFVFSSLAFIGPGSNQPGVGGGIISTNGTNVGIATTTPQIPFVVQGDALVTGVFTAGSISGGGSGTTSAGNVSAGSFGLNTGGGNYSYPASVAFGTTTTSLLPQVLSVNGGGYVRDWFGIGTSTFSSQHRFQVVNSTSVTARITTTGNSSSDYSRLILDVGGPSAGDAYIVTRASLTGGWEWSLGLDNSDSKKFKLNNGLGVDDSSVPLTVDYFNGNVGVLNENPAYALDVTGQVNSTGGLCIAGTCKTDWSVMEGGWTQLVNSVFLTSSTDRVGIGISAPSVPLHVRPLGNYDEKIRVEDTGSNEWNYIAFYDSGTRKWFAGQDNVGSFVIGREAGGGTYTRDFGITASDNVGVGTTTPAVKFQVFGDIRVGTSGTNGCLQRFSGAVIVGTCASDSRLKTNIHPLRSVLKEFLQLNPVHYSWNEIAEKELGMSTKTKELGLLAQEVEKVFPELVTVDEKGYKRVDFTALQFYSIKAIQEQQRQIEELRNLLESRDRE